MEARVTLPNTGLVDELDHAFRSAASEFVLQSDLGVDGQVALSELLDCVRLHTFDTLRHAIVPPTGDSPVGAKVEPVNRELAMAVAAAKEEAAALALQVAKCRTTHTHALPASIKSTYERKIADMEAEAAEFSLQAESLQPEDTDREARRIGLVVSREVLSEVQAAWADQHAAMDNQLAVLENAETVLHFVSKRGPVTTHMDAVLSSVPE